MIPRYVSRFAVPLIARFEGFVDHTYYDGLPTPKYPKGTPTIGFGHTPAKSGERITLAQAKSLLVRDLMKRGYVAAAEDAMPHGSDRQKAALVSAAYNLGPGILSWEHDLGRLIRTGHYAMAANSLLEYVNPGSPVEAGLRRRRKAERRLFLRGSDLKTRLRAARLPR